MYFSNLTDFIFMDGHGFYVWLAYGFSLLWITWLLLLPVLAKKRILKDISSRMQIESGRSSQQE